LRRSAARSRSAKLTDFNWKEKYGRLLPRQMLRLRYLEQDNGKLLLAVLNGAGAAVHLPRAAIVAVLERACKEVSFPATIRVDQGSEFASRDLLWAYRRGRRTGLLTAREADRQCPHRVLQR